MLKHGEVNLLNIHGLRKLEHCPPHFECVQFNSFTDEKQITDWIYENLVGRFYVGFKDVFEDNKVSHRCMIAAFEVPSEASYFSLLLPQINPENIY